MLLLLLLPRLLLLLLLLPLFQTHFEHACNNLMIHFTVPSLCNTTNQYILILLFAELHFHDGIEFFFFACPSLSIHSSCVLLDFFRGLLWYLTHPYTASDLYKHTHSYAHINKILFGFDEHTFYSTKILIAVHDANFLRIYLLFSPVTY